MRAGPCGILRRKAGEKRTEMITIEPHDEGIKELFGRLLKQLGDLRPVMAVAGDIVHSSILKNFEQGGRPGWRALSPVTIAQRTKIRRWPGRILLRQGVAGGLMGSISYQAERDRVVLSANKVYAKVHQFGAKAGSFGRFLIQVPEHTRKISKAFGRAIDPREVKVRAHEREAALPWGDIPARPFMLVQDEDWEEMRESLAEFIVLGKVG